MYEGGVFLDRRLQVSLWYKQYRDDLQHYLIYFTGRTDVEDLVQEVFVQVIKNFHQFKGEATVKTWLFSIARHIAIDAIRRDKVIKWIPLRGAEELSFSDQTPEQWLQVNEQLLELYQAINRLKVSYRDVLILKGINEFSTAETAEILEWSENKVRVTLHRAMQALKKSYPEREEGIYHEAWRR